jgi:hypothetical protein
MRRGDARPDRAPPPEHESKAADDDDSALAPSAWVAKHLGFTPDPVQTQVLDATAKRGILNCTRQWGKSTTSAAKAVHQAITRADSLTIVVSPTSRQSGEFVRKAASFLARMGIKPKGDGDNEISLAFPNGSRIVGLPGTEATVRGFSKVSLLLVDEASRVSDELYLAVRPMLAVSEGTLWLLSTPYGKRGFFYEVWTHGGPDWERVQVAAVDCPRIPVAHLQEEKRSMGDRYFRQEYGCEFTEVEDAVFNREMLERAFSHDIKPYKL